MKILLTGANGCLGRAVMEAFIKHIIISPSRFLLDVVDYSKVRLHKSFSPDVVIHLAAITDLEYCEKNNQKCYMVNTIGTMNMLRFAKDVGAIFVFVSSGGIFDGRKTSPYHEGDRPNPLNHYHQSKYYAEMGVLSYEKSYIVRSTGLFGPGGKKIVDRLIRMVTEGVSPIRVTGKKMSWTYSKDLAESILEMVEEKAPFGVYHVAGKGEASPFDIANFLVSHFNKSSFIEKVPGEFFTKDFLCPRPEHELLNSSVSEIMGFSHMRGWKEALEDYLAHYA